MPNSRRRSTLAIAAVATACLLTVPASAPAVSTARLTDVADIGGNTLATHTLAPPTNVASTDGNTVALSWTATTSARASGYYIYRSGTAGTRGPRVATINSRSTTTWSDTAPLDGANYYVITSFLSNWESGTTTESVGTKPTIVVVTDNFNGTGAPGTSEVGGRTWDQLNGTWTRAGNGTATTTTAASSNPMLVTDVGNSNVDISVNTVGYSADAIYFRAVDGDDWMRARLRRDYSTYQYYNTEYERITYGTEYQYNSTTTEYQYQTQTGSTTTYGAWSSWSNWALSTNCHPTSATVQTPSNTDTEQYRVGGTAGSSGCNVAGNYWWWRQISTRTKTVTPTYSYGWATSIPSGSTGTGATRQAVTGTYWSSTPGGNGTTRTVETGRSWSTSYCSGCATRSVGPYTGTSDDVYLVVEKSVQGTVTQLKSNYVGYISSFRIVANGSSITAYANSNSQGTVTDSTHLTATKHGCGIGGSGSYSPTNAVTYVTMTTL